MLTEKPKEINFSERRKRFISKLKKAVAVFVAPPVAIRNNDVTFPYRQDSNFYYLSGFSEPNSLCIISSQSKTPFQLFVQPKDETKELWEGKIWGPEKAKEVFGADIAFPSFPESHFDEQFINEMSQAEVLYYRLGVNPFMDQRIFRLLHQTFRKLGRTGRPLWPILDPMEILGEERLVKKEEEIERIEIAAKITAEAQKAAMKMAKPGVFEFEVEAIVHHVFGIHGARSASFETIVASGSNACVLHYIENNRRMEKNDLLLLDCGAEYDYYAGDITRTFPISGKFTQPQKEIYSAVLKAQKEAISLSSAGKTVSDIHGKVVEILVEEMKRLKLLKGPTKEIIKKNEYKKYFPHNTGHWLGMDVHDAGKYYKEKYTDLRKLEVGFVMTVEPGLYISPNSDAPAKYKGIGVRIEDDIVIGKKLCRVLTSSVPKEIEEIESLCSEK